MDKCISQVDSETKYWFPHWSQFNFYKFQVRVWSKLLDHGQDFFQIYCILAITRQLQLQSWHCTTLSWAEDSDELLATLHGNPQRSNASINHLWERPLWWPNCDSTFDWKPRNSIGSKKTRIASRVVVAYLATSWLLRAAWVSAATAVSFVLECWKLQKSALGSDIFSALMATGQKMVYLRVRKTGMKYSPQNEVLCREISTKHHLWDEEIWTSLIFPCPHSVEHHISPLQTEMLHPIATSPIAQTEGGDGQEAGKQDQHRGDQEQWQHHHLQRTLVVWEPGVHQRFDTHSITNSRVFECQGHWNFKMLNYSIDLAKIRYEEHPILPIPWFSPSFKAKTRGSVPTNRGKSPLEIAKASRSIS